MGLDFKFVTSGQHLDDAAVVSQTIRGRSLLPPPPINLRGLRNAAGDLLIEWTRRERLPLPLRDSAGTPLSEEELIFWVDIMNGASVVHSYRVLDSGTQPIMWEVVSDLSGLLTISTDGSITMAPSTGSNNASAISRQVLGGPGDGSVEFTASRDTNEELPTQFGLTRYPLVNSNPEAAYVNRTKYWIGGTTVTPVSTWYAAGNQSDSGSGYNSQVKTGTDLSVRRANDRFNYYLNYKPGVAPLFTTADLTTENFQPYIFFTPSGDLTTVKKALRCRVVRSRPAFFYTAAQQTVDFGAPQSSLTVRVAQESAIVGRGQYAQATL